MKIVSDDSRFLRELHKEIESKGIDATLVPLPTDDDSMASLFEIKLPNIKMKGKWDFSLTKVINNFINKYYKNKDKQREHELKLMEMKLVLVREVGKKELIDVEALENDLIAPPKEGDVLSIENVKKDN